MSYSKITFNLSFPRNYHIFAKKITASSDPPTVVEYSVALFRGNNTSFGLSYDTQNVVTGMVSGGAAQLSGQIRIGDKIHSINGNISSTGSDTYSILVSCATTVNMVMKRTIGKELI